jgi:histidyl-tRNA synthetase
MTDIKKIKPSLPKGTRDFLPEEVAKRNYIFDTNQERLSQVWFSADRYTCIRKARNLDW